MWYNLYTRGGVLEYGNGHPTEQYAKAVKHGDCKRCQYVETVFLPLPPQ